MGRPPGWTTARTGRLAMRSPGRPPVARREHRQWFWEAIARGLSSEEAGVASGVSPAVGTRWFREAGGMRSISLAPLSARFLSFAEREEIAVLHAAQRSVRDSGRHLGRSPSTISRELRRNAATRGGQLQYRAIAAQWHADRRAQRPKPAKLAAQQQLHDYVQERLAGAIRRPNGTPISGPTVRWVGRRHGRRKDRRWSSAWSPEQIAKRLPIDYPDDGSMRISHEAIYQALYVQGRGALRRDLSACLRTGRALRVPRVRTRRGKDFVTAEIMISERPAEVADRAVPGHWEGDLIMGKDNLSAVGTLVERSTRYTLLLHLGAGKDALSVKKAMKKAIRTLPSKLVKTITWDQGCEMGRHVDFTIETNIPVYFCDPHSPWQRGSNENTNGLLRQYMPKGTDLSVHSEKDLAGFARSLNDRPRMTLGYLKPSEKLAELIALTP